MSNDMLKGKWKEIKGEIQSAWGDVNADELDRTQGNLTSIAGLIQQKYAHAKEDISHKLNEIIGRFDAPADRGAEDARRPPISGALEDVKNNLRQS